MDSTTVNQKIKTLFLSYFRLWGLYIVYGFATVFLYMWFPELSDTSYEQTAIKEMLDASPFKLFILACVFAPIVEEMMFRTLIKPTYHDVLLFLASWFVFLSLPFLSGDIHWALNLLLSGLLLYALFFLLKRWIPEEKTIVIQDFLHKNTTLILIITSCIFGLVHIGNYVDGFLINTALILLIIPRVISGFMMGWIKIKNQGLIWSMGLHFLNNAVALGLILLTR